MTALQFKMTGTKGLFVILAVPKYRGQVTQLMSLNMPIQKLKSKKKPTMR